jgi:hypothetical protein
MVTSPKSNESRYIIRIEPTWETSADCRPIPIEPHCKEREGAALRMAVSESALL